MGGGSVNDQDLVAVGPGWVALHRQLGPGDNTPK